MMFEELNPPYSTIVVDPPWHYDKSNPDAPARNQEESKGHSSSGSHARGRGLSYSSMAVAEIKALPVSDLGDNARCFLWTTNRYLRQSWGVLEAWGFEPHDRVLVWCKPPMGTLNVTTEFVLIGRRGRPPRMPWSPTTWFPWARPHHAHSTKPAAFFDLVESWCPGPYLDLFSRSPRLGWDSWGLGYEGVA